MGVAGPLRERLPRRLEGRLRAHVRHRLQAPSVLAEVLQLKMGYNLNTAVMKRNVRVREHLFLLQSPSKRLFLGCLNSSRGGAGITQPTKSLFEGLSTVTRPAV